jgi:hypothetical protein
MTRLSILAYSTPSQHDAVLWATRSIPLRSPPIDHSFPYLQTRLLQLTQRKPALLYLALHGYADNPNLYGQGTVALTPANIAPLDLSNVTIFAPSCHLSESAMLPALLARHPKAVVCGSGPNWSPFVHRLGRTFVLLTRLRLSATVALKIARARLSLWSDHPLALDTLALQVHQPKEV